MVHFAVALRSLPYGMVEALPPHHRSEANQADPQLGADASRVSTPVASAPVVHEGEGRLQVWIAFE